MKVHAIDMSRLATFRCLLTPTFAVVIVCLLYVTAVLISAQGDPLAFAALGTRFSQDGPQATERLLLHFGVSRWYALSYGLYGSQLLALRTDLNEPLAQALIQCAMLAWAKDRRPTAVCACDQAPLTKERTSIFLAHGRHRLLQEIPIKQPGCP